MSSKQRKRAKKGVDLPYVHSITLPEAGYSGTNYGLSLAHTHDGEVCIDESSSIFEYCDRVIFLARYLFGLKEWPAMEKWQQSAVVMFARKSGRHNSFTIAKVLEGEDCNSHWPWLILIGLF